MNLKVLFGAIGILIVALFGYNYYSSKKNAEKMAAIQAETAKTKAEANKMAADLKSQEQQKEVVKNAKEEIALLSPTGKSFLYKKLPNADTQNFNPVDKNAETIGREKLKGLMKRWTDNTELASRTPRVSLPNVVKSLQEDKREVETYNLTPCLTLAQAHLYSAMDSQVNAYLEFMSKNESSSSDYMKQGTEDLSKFSSKIARCQ